MARAYSTDSTAARAGYTGLVDASSLDKLDREFSAALKGLKPGAVSSVVRVGEGFVLLKWATDDRGQLEIPIRQRSGRIGAGPIWGSSIPLSWGGSSAEKFGTADVRLADSLNGLAQTYRYQQNYAEAEPVARRSLAYSSERWTFK